MNTQLRDQQIQTLGEVQVVNFTANPTQVKPFGKTTLSWKVQLPTAPITLLVGAQRNHVRIARRDTGGFWNERLAAQGRRAIDLEERPA